MGKREEELLFDHTGAVDVEAMRDEREPSDIPYAPPPDQDAKWKALAAVGAMPKWNGTMKGVMTCVIQCANYYSGKSCPSEEWIAGRLHCTDRAVRKALANIEKKFPKFLLVHHRSEPGRSEWKANAYVIGWSALIHACHAAFPWTAQRRNERSGTEEQTFLTRRNESSCELIEEELIEGTYRHKVALPPSAADAYSFSSLSENQKPEPSTSVPVDGPKGFSEKGRPYSESAARQRVDRHIAGDQFVRENPPSPAVYAEAVAAERREDGSGRAILSRAANDTWKARRSA